MMKKLYTLFIFIALGMIAINAQTRYAAHSLLSSGKWAKVRVSNEGVYQLTKAELTKMGFSDPAKVRLYGYNVPMLPETELEHFDDDLTEIPVLRKADGTMLFYSCGTIKWSFANASFDPNDKAFVHTNNPYSTHVYYFLTEDTSSQPLALETEEEFTATNTMTTFKEHSLVESDEYSFLSAGRTFFEGYDFSTGSTRSYTIHLPGIASTDVTVAVQFCAAGSSSSSLSISSGETQLATLNFTKLKEYIYGDVKNRTFTWSNVVSEKPVLRLTHTHTTGCTGHLDYIRATYERKLAIGTEGYLVFRTQTPTQSNAEITGANENTKVLRVTTPWLTALQNGTLNNGIYTAKVRSTEKNGDTFVAINTNATFSSPEFVGKVTNQDLHSLENYELIIIVPANGRMTAQAQRLADAHNAKEGMRCIVVKADEIYNEFSSGTPDATAYRRFMKMLYDKANYAKNTKADETTDGEPILQPKNLLLFGSCVWDNRLVTTGLRTKKQDDLLLCYESENSVSHTNSYVAEEYFTLLADGKGLSPLKEKPDCGIGRLPVTTESEAKAAVDKIIRYINGNDFGSWANTICMLADDGAAKDGNPNIHGEDAENIAANMSSLYPDFRYKKIYWDSFELQQSSTGNTYPGAYNEVNKIMTDGALIMNYTGHGAPYCLSHEQVLRTSDFLSWNSPRLPLWITAACDVVPFDMNTSNLGAEAVISSKGAAIGFVGTARTVYSTQNRTINRYFMNYVLSSKDNGERYTIGEALAQAKASIIDNGRISMRDSLNKAHFILIGDPAITLPTSTYKVKIDKLNGKLATSELQTISAGEIVTVEGHIEDANGNPVNDFDGIISPSVFDNEETIVCKDNTGLAAAADEEPLTYRDRPRTIFTGNDSIRSGQFTFSFPVPLDINYSNLQGLINLHAINSDHSIMANGSFTRFIVGGTTADELTDTIGPSIQLAFYDNVSMGANQANVLSETPTIVATISDDNGINTTGSGIGHDIVAIIDNNESTTYTLNSYYSQNTGDYRSGTLSFTVPAALPAGEHTLTLRAFDTLNNMGEVNVAFTVVEGMEAETEIFDMAGRKMLGHDAGHSLPKGVYIRRISITDVNGNTVGEKSEKFIVTQ